MENIEIKPIVLTEQEKETLRIDAVLRTLTVRDLRLGASAMLGLPDRDLEEALKQAHRTSSQYEWLGR
jgi:hypothetical protein